MSLGHVAGAGVMRNSIAEKLNAKLTQSQRAALITLLADDDPTVYQSIRGKILASGPAAADWLRAHALSKDPILRRRVQEILQHFARQAADNAFLGFCLKNQGANFDLETALWLLARTRYPDLNIDAYQAQLDDYAATLLERITPAAKPKRTLTTINQLLFEELGFKGDEEDYYAPENSYLNCVIDRRRGNPISLCLIYLLLTSRLKMPVVGIGLPGHFLARYQDSATEIYIDAFYQGRFLTKNDCIHHLVHENYSLDEAHFSPATPHRILMRVCANLYQSHRSAKQEAEATRFQRYIMALAR